MTTPPEPPRQIETQRLLLRPAHETDFDAIHAYAVDPDTIRYMLWGPNTPDVTRHRLDQWLAQDGVWPRPDLNYVVEVKDGGAVIGVCTLHDPASRNGYLGYCYHSAHWRRGYGTEAARAVADMAFRTLGHHRIWATCDVRNVGSWWIMEKLGMRREGTLRQHELARDGWRDSYLYALLAEEWRRASDISPG